MPETTSPFIDWEYLADQIANEKCILVIGPELARSNTGPSMEAFIAERCRQEGTPEPFYYNQDGFFSFVNSKSRARTRYFIQKYFETAEIPEIYQDLVRIPFHLIISLSPDIFLKRAFEERNRSFHFSYYDKNGQQSDIPPPSMGDPVIYNLLGTVEKSQSLIFTYNDLFAYVEKIYNDNDLPSELRLKLEKGHVENYIFLGVKFEKWYLKLLFRLLKIQQVDDNYASLKSGVLQLDPHVQSFYPRHFNVQFVEEDVEGFVKKLSATCEEHIEPINSIAGPDLYEMVLNCIAEDALLQAFEVLEKYAADYTIDSQALKILQGSYNGLMTKIDRESIDYRVAKVELGIIKEKLIGIAQRARKR